ncbi:hypothetical protein GOODEAATRI_000669 [Goodea atripinnis]|uniref:Fibronectin type-III domain-containing protein n=1 Tax=Goodea atripinnis TaxID=208336 RepID=A0ABV0PJT7_9TELE
MSEDRPSAPRNVHAETISSSAILLAWDRPLYNADKVIAYSIHYMKAEGLNNEEYQVVIGNDTTSYIIDDLEPARNYSFYIVAYMPMGASRMSDQVSQHTLEDVPLRTPELTLTSHSSTDIQVTWQPLPAKISRGRVLAYRLSYRTAIDDTVINVELSQNSTEHLLEGLQPDTIYLLRIAVATRVGWCEPSAWTSHRTPKIFSNKAPVLQLEALNCTSIRARWQPSLNSVAALGFRLCYHEEGQPEQPSILLQAQTYSYTFGGLGVRVTLIEDDTALVSWRESTEPNLVVTHYTILYATQQAWMAGRWQRIQREGTHTMALLEKLEPGNVYLVKICASNKVGDGPFSNIVELAPMRGHVHRSKNPRHSDSFPDTAGPLPASSREIIYGPLHSESSHSSEGSQETGDSGHYSNEESNEEMSNSSTCQSSRTTRLESENVTAGPNLKQAVKLEAEGMPFHHSAPEASWPTGTSGDSHPQAACS